MMATSITTETIQSSSNISVISLLPLCPNSRKLLQYIKGGTIKMLTKSSKKLETEPNKT